MSAADLFTTEVPWYVDQVPSIQPSMRQLLVEYASVAPDDVNKHVQAVRDEAWRAAPFPCVGSFLFAELALSTFPAYAELVERLKSDGAQRYLEVGCGLGQDVRKVCVLRRSIRPPRLPTASSPSTNVGFCSVISLTPHKLIHDGVSPSAIHATDLVPGLINAGYKLFNDTRSTSPLFLPGVDFLDTSPGNALNQLAGTIDVVHASMFLHCFDFPTQPRACVRIISLLKQKPGSTVVGRQGGVARDSEPREEEVKGPMGRLGGVVRTNYLHNEKSFVEMWENAGKETGTKWGVEVGTEDVDRADRGRLYFSAAEHRWLRFKVVRLE